MAPMWDGIWGQIFDEATFKKTFVVFLFAPIWWPIAKAFWKEIQGALAPDGGFLGKSDAGDIEERETRYDPWVNVPLRATRQERKDLMNGELTPQPRGRANAAPPKKGARASATPRRRTF